MTDGPQGESAEPAHVRRTRVRVRYAETDRMGFAYYANYLTWFEVARVEWLRQGGWSYRDMEHEGIVLPVIEAHCEYRHPVRYDDELEISARGTLLTPVRVKFDYEVRSMLDKTLTTMGHTVHAAVDDRGRPRRLPARVLDMLR